MGEKASQAKRRAAWLAGQPPSGKAAAAEPGASAAEEQAFAWQNLAPTVVLWVLLRVGLSLWAALLSLRFAKHSLEQALPLWPPGQPLGLWLERVLLLPWLRWDVAYYLKIVEQGYRLDDGTAQFHPLLPWLAALASNILGIGGLASLLLVASLAALGLLMAFEQLARLDLDAATARRARLYLALFPASFIFFAPYTEGLFLLCAVLALLGARRKQWLFAGLMGGLAALTRQQGIVLLLPLAWEIGAWARAEGQRLRAEQPGRHGGWGQWLLQAATLRALLALTLVPLGFLTFKVYRALTLDDLRIDLSNPQALIYSFFISPSSSKVVPVQAFLPPWEVLAAAWRALQSPGNLTTAIDLTLAAIFLLLLALGWRHLRPSYLIYTLAILLLSFSYYTGPFYPLMGLPRHCVLAVPLFLPLAIWGRRPWLHLLIVAAGLAGMLFLMVGYVAQAWVP